jgi:hypothetical protein
MGKFRNIIDHLREQLESDRLVLADLQSGKTTDFEFQVGERVDVTAASIKATEARIARNERLIEVYEKKDA